MRGIWGKEEEGAWKLRPRAELQPCSLNSSLLAIRGGFGSVSWCHLASIVGFLLEAAALEVWDSELWASVGPMCLTASLPSSLASTGYFLCPTRCWPHRRPGQSSTPPSQPPATIDLC